MSPSWYLQISGKLYYASDCRLINIYILIEERAGIEHSLRLSLSLIFDTTN